MTKEAEVVAGLVSATELGHLKWEHLPQAGVMYDDQFVASLPTGRTFVVTTLGPGGETGIRLEIRNRDDAIAHVMKSGGADPLAEVLRTLLATVQRQYAEPLDQTLEEIRALTSGGA